MLSANQLKLNGMADAMASAGRQFETHALDEFRRWALQRKVNHQIYFRMEEFRAHCESIGLEPSTHKAWGGFTSSLARANAIRKIGFMSATSPKTHAHPVYEWWIV